MPPPRARAADRRAPRLHRAAPVRSALDGRADALRLPVELELLELLTRDGLPRRLERVLEVRARDEALRVDEDLAGVRLLDVLADGQLARALADFRQVGAREALGAVGDLVEADVLGHRRLARVRVQDGHAARVVGERHVDELVQPAGARHRRVEHVGPVGGAEDEDVLRGAHAVDLGQNLVDDAVTRLTAAGGGAARLCDRVDLVEEEDARRRSTRLVEELAHVGFGLAEPHGEELGPLDGDEVGLALVRHRLGHQRLAAAGRAVHEHALRGGHAELAKLALVADRELDRLHQLALNELEAAHVGPRHVGRDLGRFVAQ
mmetsp:Transcript_9838/g.25932  ORF Transcript_9838/g.25932 Transcript_9838/m.25932 type:complete len:320 (+) Transcript_9838:136-1095(+)